MRIILMLGLALSSFSTLAAVNVNVINDQIARENARWVAKSNRVSELPDAQIKKMMGNNEKIITHVDYSDVYKNSVSYESLDWRNVNGTNWLGPVLNQGNCGSCVAFAAIGTLEAQISIATGASFLKPQFSTQALFACGGGSCDRGWIPATAASYVKRNGVIDNACAPYTMGSDGKDVTCSNFCQNQTGRTYQVAGTYNPTGFLNSNAQKVKDALKKGPLITSMTVYEDFLTYSSGIYKAVSKKSVGGHAVSIVGYNDQERYWIVRNSWGADWGENGFVRISWDDKSGIAGSTYGFDISKETNVVTIASPAENDYVYGDVKMKTLALNAEEVQINVLKNGTTVQTLASDNELNTLQLADGKYELQATSASGVKSLVRGFTIANSAPTMSLSFALHGEGDLNAIKGRLEFDVNVSSAPVQMQKIDLLVTKLDGTMVARRTTEVVLNKMLLGFRFNSIPNGEYLLFFRGYLPATGKMNTVESAKVKVFNKN